METKITSKGQVTIPKPIRVQFGLKAGQRLIFIPAEGEIVIRPKIKGLQGLIELRKQLATSGRLLSEEKARQMIAESKKEWSKFN